VYDVWEGVYASVTPAPRIFTPAFSGYGLVRV
jgi:hypothetical protein